MDPALNYFKIERGEWQTFQLEKELRISAHELAKITSLNDKVSMQDIREIYIPLLHFLDLYYENYLHLQAQKQVFMKKEKTPTPFIIGISGSVAVGKSTTARLIQTLLERMFPEKKVDLVTTDGFLYATQKLVAMNLLHRKGFPESYDMEALIQFLLAIKTNQPHVKCPIYSHRRYDVIPGKYQVIHQPDILIVEGINVLQLPANREIFVSDYFDLSIYVDASEDNLEKWFLERFNLLMDMAAGQPDNYYHELAKGDRNQALEVAKTIWQTINLKNLKEYILPTKTRADFIIHKGDHHMIDYFLLKKY